MDQLIQVPKDEISSHDMVCNTSLWVQVSKSQVDVGLENGNVKRCVWSNLMELFNFVMS